MPSNYYTMNYLSKIDLIHERIISSNSFLPISDPWWGLGAIIGKKFPTQVLRQQYFRTKMLGIFQSKLSKVSDFIANKII